MSEVNVRLCDIRGCKNLADHLYSNIMWAEQEGGDGSFTTYLVEGPIDLCGSHEYEYRSSLPKIQLKESFQNIIPVSSWVVNKEAK